MQERLQDAESNGVGEEEKAKAGPPKSPRSSSRPPRGKSGRFERRNGGEADTDLSPRTLLTRLEQQSGQLGILRSKLEETRKLATRERQAAEGAAQALQEERRAREQMESTLKRERLARLQAEETLEESRATASALEAQHHLLRAQLKALEHKRRGRLFRRGR